MNRFLAPLILLIFSTSMQSQERSADMPKLVVGITIDQLRTDYIDMMQHLFGEGGFKRLIKEGAVYENIDYGFNDITKSSSVATVYTGTYPATHSITSDTRFNKEKKEAAIITPAAIPNIESINVLFTFLKKNTIEAPKAVTP